MIISDPAKERLERYCANILKWNKTHNLISSSQKNDLWERHIIDSIRIYEYISEYNDILVVDYGSGAGFPALPCAIIAENDKKNIRFLMIESVNKKASFLSDTIRTLGLNNIEVKCDRIENIKDIEADIITARAFAKIDDIFSISEDYLKTNTRFLLLKGRNIQQEIARAQEKFTFDYKLVNSINGDGFIFIAENVKNT